MPDLMVAAGDHSMLSEKWDLFTRDKLKPRAAKIIHFLTKEDQRPSPIFRPAIDFSATSWQTVQEQVS